MIKQISAEFPYPVWKIKVGQNQEQWALELREKEHKIVRFAHLTIDNHALVPSTLMPGPDEWWSGLEALHGEIAVIHGYAEKELPVHLGLGLWKRGSMQMHSWEPEHTYEGALPQYILARLQDGQAMRVARIDPYSGKEDPSAAGEEDLLLQAQRYEDQMQSRLAFPQWTNRTLFEGKPGIPNWNASTINGDVAFLNFGDYQIYAWHSRNSSGQHELRLQVFEDNEPVFDHLIETGMELLNPNPYFLDGKSIVCITNRKSITRIELDSDT